MKETIILKELGKIYGRDAVYLDEINFTEPKKIVLKGEFNSSLCEKKITKNKFIPFFLTFKQVLHFSMTEVDFVKYDGSNVGNISKVKDSPKIKEFSKRIEAHKLTNNHIHYVIETYDYVVEIIAISFDLEIEDKL